MMGRKPFYDKNKPKLMKDFLQEMNLKKGVPFEKNKFIENFQKKYPLFETISIEKTLTRFSTNDPGRRIYKPAKDDDILYKVDAYTFRLFDEENDPFPIHEETEKENVASIKKDKHQNETYCEEIRRYWAHKKEYRFENGNKEFRYALGYEGNKTLYFLGLNPSKANLKETDNTEDIVQEVVYNHKEKFDSYILLNIYPKRSTEFNELEYLEDKDNLEHEKNKSIIKDVIKNGSCVWAAWGSSIKKKKWLRDCLIDILNELKNRNIRWKKVGKLLNDNIPPHPSRKKKPYPPLSEIKIDIQKGSYIIVDPISSNFHNKDEVSSNSKIYISKNDTHSESSEIIKHVKEIFVLINKNSKKIGGKSIFKEKNITELWMGIEKHCFSHEAFNYFATSLFDLFLENARDKIEKNKYEGINQYVSRFPDEFIEKHKEFILDVKIIRNEYAAHHIDDDFNKKPKRTKEDVLKKYLDSPSEPENFEKFHIEVLKEFEIVMHDLHQIVKNNLNKLSTHNSL